MCAICPQPPSLDDFLRRELTRLLDEYLEKVQPQPTPQTHPALVRETATCSCGQMWNSILPPPPCPVHGQTYSPKVTY